VRPASGSAPPPRVALTVDAEHPDGSRCRAGNDERILDALGEAGVRATFFLQGRWVTAHPQLARAVAAQGHLIGNHSHHHVRMPLLSAAGLRADVLAAQGAIQEVVGVDPRPLFRTPFGTGRDDPAFDRSLARLGYRNVLWDVDGADWEADRGVGAVLERLVAGCLGGSGVRIALVHSWPDQTAAALPMMLDRLRRAGTEFVTVDRLAPDLPGPAAGTGPAAPSARCSS